jgi:hypothetical protein
VGLPARQPPAPPAPPAARAPASAAPAPAPIPSPGLLHRVLGVEATLGALLLATFAAICLVPLRDPDLGWHLAAGDRVLDGLGVPWTDPYSWVAQGRDWFAYSWLPEVVFAICRRACGDVGLIALGAALVAALGGVVLASCRATGARTSVALAATTAAMLAASGSFTVRPHLVSFLCMAVVVHVVLLDRMGRRDRSWWLVPVTVVWANSHVLFPFGLAVVGLHVVSRPSRWSIDRAALLVALGLAPLATPYGWHLLHYVTVLAREPVAFELVAEFATPSLHGATGQALTALFFATLVVLVYSPVHRDVAEVVTLFGFAWLAYAMARNVPFFAIVAAPILARHADALLPPPSARPRPGAAVLALHALLLVAAGGALGARLAPLRAPDAAVDRHRLPVDAVRWLAARRPLGRLMNHFDWGGYLIGTLYPRYQVSMDGRTNVYGEETLAEYARMTALAPGWRAFLDRWRPDVILWPRQTAFAEVLALLPDWRRVYADDVAVIFVRRRPPLQFGAGWADTPGGTLGESMPECAT